MSRPLRIEYPGAWYHVMNRGRGSEVVFPTKKDYDCFLEILKESVTMWGVNIGAFCLLPNHYHILIQTPEGNLSRCMRHINGVYTQRFNRRHSTDGSLFRGRYRSILVGEESYLFELVRYIHRNPLRAGLVKDLNKYPWSSHKGYLSVSKKWDWISKNFLFNYLGKDRTTQQKEYRSFIRKEDSKEVLEYFSKKKLLSIIGSEKFKNWVKEKFSYFRYHEEIPGRKELAIEVESIKTIVSNVYRVKYKTLHGIKRKVKNEPRNVAIYLTRKLRRDKLETIGKEFAISKYSTVSTILEDMKEKLSLDRKLRKFIASIEIKLYKSQQQT